MLPVVSHEVKTGKWPYVTICLIGLNVLAFAFEASVGVRFASFLQEWGLVPSRVNAEVTVHNLATVGTSLFLHVGWVHLIGNMWFLYVFGDPLEDALGPRWFLSLYLLCGFFGGMAFIAADRGLLIPAVGASGAISGVLGASVVIWPTARLKIPALWLALILVLAAYPVLVDMGIPPVFLGGSVLLFALSVAASIVMTRGGMRLLKASLATWALPAWAVLGFFLLWNLGSGGLALVNPAFGGAVGWWAHVGGFVAGAIFGLVFPKNPIILRRRALLE